MGRLVDAYDSGHSQGTRDLAAGTIRPALDWALGRYGDAAAAAAEVDAAENGYRDGLRGVHLVDDEW